MSSKVKVDEAAYAATIADKVRFRPEMVCRCGNLGCYDLTTEMLCRTCWQAKSARMQQNYAPVGMLIVDGELNARACERMQSLEQEIAAIKQGLKIEYAQGEPSGDVVADFGTFLEHHKLKEQENKILREQVTKLREALQYIGGQTEHGHEGTIVPCRICRTVDKALAETESQEQQPGGAR